MSILPIVTVPDPILRETSEPVERVDDDTRKLVADMLETMYDAPGLGLAAIQVGVPRRIVVADVGVKEDREARAPICMINPEIIYRGQSMKSYEEGCLSLPDIHVEIDRPSDIRFRYVDTTGQQQERDASGLLATVVQHEVDHLDGRLIIDFLSKLRRDMVVRKLKKTARTA
ncbi:MAG: peptide deformylase [Pseudomonadota bacterium]